MTETIIVVDYVTEDGRNPFRQWLSELRDKRAAARVQSRLDRLSMVISVTPGPLAKA